VHGATLTDLKVKNSPTTKVYVVVIGADPAGIAALFSLKRAGVCSFLVLEREAAIGGVWRDNTCPDVAYDVPSFPYSFTFETNRRGGGY
jgi:cation diffusion facilitator CzcD-associated flavoprotein CzcO